MNEMRMPPEAPASWRDYPVLAALAAVAVLAGVYARFKGLGTWPLGVDEYYVARSVQNILHAGLPEYACGGFYTRGLLVQYLGAFLQLGGMSSELSLRLIAAVGSLAVLPAGYILGRRVGGPLIGLLTVIVLALSLWEVEMGRFARMYAPFQAIFAWYTVYFIRYTVDREARALWPMLGLSLIGTFVWEGGVLLAATNFLPPLLNARSGRLGARDWRYLAGCVALLLPLYLFTTGNLRTLGSDLPYPPGFEQPEIAQSLMGASVGSALGTTLASHPVWCAMALVPLVSLLFAARWVLTLRRRWLTALGLGAALLAAALHQFGLVVAILLLLLLAGLLSWRELLSRAAAPFGIALGLSAVFWIAYGLATHDWRADPNQSALRTALLLGHELVRFPDFALEIALPWARAVPVLGLALFVLIGAACIRLVMKEDGTFSAERAILVLMVVLLLAASASHPPRHETRYVFFLYPLGLIIGLVMLARTAETAVRSLRASARRPALLASLLALGGFAMTEDFDLQHLRHVDSEAVQFRQGLSPALAQHLISRTNVRTAAEWLSRNTDSDDIVIDSLQNLGFYYPKIDYFYMNWADQRFAGWTCRGGTIERWGNTPLLYTAAALEAQLQTGKRVFFVLPETQIAAMLPTLAPYHPKTAWVHGTIRILRFDPGMSGPQTASSAQAAQPAN